MGINDSQINKPERGCPKRAELPDVNINTGAQGINTERLAGKPYKCAYILSIVCKPMNIKKFQNAFAMGQSKERNSPSIRKVSLRS